MTEVKDMLRFVTQKKEIPSKEETVDVAIRISADFYEEVKERMGKIGYSDFGRLVGDSLRFYVGLRDSLKENRVCR